MKLKKMKQSLYMNAIILMGLMLSMNSLTQAQESTAQIPSAPMSSDSTTLSTDSSKQVERVEVIGSRIKRINKEGSTAVKNVGKESMAISANTSASDSLRDSTVATYGASREASGSSAAATATIGLRGLGDTRTLVLLNGHRLPKDPSAEAVDLNLIPQSAIERIEVLKDGASALYGSDALGGVINIVTKKGYVGTEAAVKMSGVEKPGGTAYDISMLTGLASEKSDFMAVLSYNHSDKIFGKDRDITKDGLSSNGIAAVWKPAAGAWNLAQPGLCPPDLLRNTPAGPRCYFRYNEIATTRPQIGQLSLLTDYTYRMDSGLKFYNRNLIVHKDIEWSYAPAPIGADTEITNGTASQPTARAISYRFMEAGNRDNKDVEFNFSSLFGLKGNLTSIWEYDVSAGYSEINRKDKGVGGYINSKKLLALINSGAYDPLTPGGPTGSMRSTLETPYQDSKSKLLSVDTVFTGELGEMEHGAIGVATGFSYFNEKLDQKTDEASAAGDIIGSSGSNEKGSRDVESVFIETSFPVTKDLEFDLAARADHYSDFGSTINPKLSAKYTVNSSLLFRSSVGTGFKAPTLSQLYSGGSEGFPTFIDRKMCAVDSSYCSASQYFVKGGGNKDLKEEKAFSASLGTVAQLTTQSSLSIDAWYTKISNLVSINYEDLTQAELNGINPQNYGVTVDRDPVTGEIVEISAVDLNLAEEEVSGIDLNYETVLMDGVLGHQLGFENDYSYMLFDKYEGFPGAGKRNIIREWGSPQWRNVATLSLKNEVSTYSLTLRSIPGQNVQDREINRKISDLNEWDVSASYKLTKLSQVGGGVKNIMNAAQPADVGGGAGGATDVNNSLYDVNGRKFFVSYSQKF